jgi:hypothetical protein
MTAQPHGANIVRRQSRSDNTVMDCIYIRNRLNLYIVVHDFAINLFE